MIKHKLLSIIIYILLFLLGTAGIVLGKGTHIEEDKTRINCEDGDKVLIEHIGKQFKPMGPFVIKCSNRIESVSIESGHDQTVFENYPDFFGYTIIFNHATFENVISIIKSSGEPLEIARTKGYESGFIFTIYRENQVEQELSFVRKHARKIFTELCKLVKNGDSKAYNPFPEVIARLSPHGSVKGDACEPCVKDGQPLD